jgi:hypothetical protein
VGFGPLSTLKCRNLILLGSYPSNPSWGPHPAKAPGQGWLSYHLHHHTTCNPRGFGSATSSSESNRPSHLGTMMASAQQGSKGDPSPASPSQPKNSKMHPCVVLRERQRKDHTELEWQNGGSHTSEASVWGGVHESPDGAKRHGYPNSVQSCCCLQSLLADAVSFASTSEGKLSKFAANHIRLKVVKLWSSCLRPSSKVLPCPT